MSQLPDSPSPSMSAHILPSSVSQVGTVTKYELVNYFRSRRFFVLLIIGVIISALLVVLVGYYRPADFMSSSLKFYYNWFIGSITFVIILYRIFYGGDAISGEFQKQ